MINKLYDKIKNIIKRNYKFFLSLIIIFLVFTVKLPYYIEAPGGILDVSSRVEIKNNKNVTGSFNLAYVSEFKATLPTLIYAFFSDDWDIYKKEEIIKNETIEQIEYRNHLLLEEANNNAVIVAFNKAGKTISIKNRKVNVIYINDNAMTDLKVGDQIIEVNNTIIDSKQQLIDTLKNLDGKIEFKVINENKTYNRYAYKKMFDNQYIIGFVISETKEIDTNNYVTFKFKSTESGPSGGFMTALSIYNSLIDDDITNGLKIVGTGTIDELGLVGSIGGIEYKIKAACKKKADLFFVPVDNYEEAKKTTEENNLKINLISIENIDDAINFLKNY